MDILTPPSVFIEPRVRCLPRVRIFESPSKRGKGFVGRDCNINRTVGREFKTFIVRRRVIDVSMPPPI